ncbi:hypothetical protein D8682_15030 [Buttiauxella sp. 3AFRM03]|nr:hypothetical protein D8682_15030 [Buttiauxella sp. 3AFRM03]
MVCGTVYTRHTSSCIFVGCDRSPESLTYVSSSGFVLLPPRCNLNYLGIETQQAKGFAFCHLFAVVKCFR